MDARISGKEKLHSRYNPAAEAERYINSLSLRTDSERGAGRRYFILIEPGLGYMIPVLERKFPGAGIAALHVEDYDIQAVLEAIIPDTEASNIEIIEWKPALNLYKEHYLRLLSEAAAFIKRSDANKRTTAYFGKKWFRNFFKNIALAVRAPRADFSLLYGASVPCVVTGAGPSLEGAIPVIKHLQETERAFVLAASSSAKALLYAGVRPDMVIGTDGGNWALFHTFASAARGIPLAAGSFAVLPSRAASAPLLFISDGSRWQRLALTDSGVPFIALPERGTVTASALDLAFALFKGGVFIAGMDLSNDDIRAHARPYALDFYLDGDVRLAPAYSEAFARALPHSGSMNIYADWFKKQLPAYPPRLYTIGGNHPVFSTLPSYKDAPRSPDTAGLTRIAVQEPRIEGREKLAALCGERLMIAVSADENIRQELKSLLSTDDDEVIYNEIRHVCKEYEKCEKMEKIR
jgi:hypothetical protein